MQVSSALNIQNRGTFHIEDTAFKAGGSEADRQSSGEQYMMFNDQVQFQQLPTHPEYFEEETSKVMKVVNHMFNMDTRVYIAFIVTAFFSAFFQSIVANLFLTVIGSVVFFVVWYVMSFFDFQKVFHIIMNGSPQQQEQQQAYPAY